MKLYEFITPSDIITFYATNNDVAWATAIMVGGGKAGIKAVDGSDTKPSLVAFSGFGQYQAEFEKVMNENTQDVLDATQTFAVVSPDKRSEFDVYTKNCTDKRLVKQWNDRHRTSMSDWCKYAHSFKRK